MLKSIIKYSLIAGMLSTTLSLLNWFGVSPNFGYRASEIVGYTSIILSLMTIPLAIKHYKTTVNQNVRFADGLKIGLSISFLSATFMFIYAYCFFLFQGDEFMEWAQEGMSPEQWANMQQQMAEMPDYMMAPWFQGMVMFVTVFVIGLIVTLISSFVQKSNLSTTAPLKDTL